MDHLDTDLLRTFVAIAETGSFSRAGTRIGRTPSAVSMQVKRLEELVGRRLFERDSRTVSLTPIAEAVLPDARRVLEGSAALLSRLRTPDLEGSIALGIAEDYAAIHMPSILKRFARSHPAVQVEVICDDSTFLLGKLIGGEIDAALVTETQLDPVHNVLSDLVHVEAIGWIGARDGRAAAIRPLPVAAASPVCLWRRAAASALERARIPYRVAYTSVLSSGQLAAVAADLAVSPLPLSLVSEKVRPVPREFGLPDLPASTLAFVRRSDEDATVRAIHEHVRGLFGEGARTSLAA